MLLDHPITVDYSLTAKVDDLNALVKAIKAQAWVRVERAEEAVELERKRDILVVSGTKFEELAEIDVQAFLQEIMASGVV